LFTHYIPKVFFVIRNEKAYLNTNPVAKKTPKRRKIYIPKVVQRKSRRIHIKQPSTNVHGKIAKEATNSASN